MAKINWEEMGNINWEEMAKNILEKEKILKTCNYPVPISVLITHKGCVYIGSIQNVAPELSDEIVLLSKSSYKLPDELVNAIRKLDEKRLELDAEDSLDLNGRQHILRRVENRLIYMTSEQTKHIAEHLPNVYEL
jgi:hypothetical protein